MHERIGRAVDNNRCPFIRGKNNFLTHSLIELEGLGQSEHADVVGGAEVALVLPHLRHVPLLLGTVGAAQAVVACSR